MDNKEFEDNDLDKNEFEENDNQSQSIYRQPAEIYNQALQEASDWWDELTQNQRENFTKQFYHSYVKGKLYSPPPEELNIGQIYYIYKKIVEYTNHVEISQKFTHEDMEDALRKLQSILPIRNDNSLYEAIPLFMFLPSGEKYLKDHVWNYIQDRIDFDKNGEPIRDGRLSLTFANIFKRAIDDFNSDPNREEAEKIQAGWILSWNALSLFLQGTKAEEMFKALKSL